MATPAIPKQHKAAQFMKAKTDMEIVTKDTPAPGEYEVLIKVTASGICASDHFTHQGAMNSPYPLSAGHEVVGRIAAVGARVDPKRWPVGRRVGLGWNGGYCTFCQPCRQGDFIHCVESRVTGVTIDGGHQEYVVARENAVVDMSFAGAEQTLSDAELAPLLCAGNTVAEALLHSGARSGDVVCVQGLGGLGHLAVQIARKAGFVVACVSHSPDKKSLALDKLHAHHYFSTADDGGDLAKQFTDTVGLAKAVICTAPSGSAPNELIPILQRYGTLVIVGTPNDGKPLEVDTMQLILKCASVRGAACGSAASNDKFTSWCNLEQIRPMISEYPLDKAQQAFEDTMNNKARFRNVLVMP